MIVMERSMSRSQASESIVAREWALALSRESRSVRLQRVASCVAYVVARRALRLATDEMMTVMAASMSSSRIPG
jgi:hypothetical protein